MHKQIMILLTAGASLVAAGAGAGSKANDGRSIGRQECGSEGRRGGVARAAVRQAHGQDAGEPGTDRVRLQRDTKRPNVVRTEYTLQGMTAVNAFDGKEGWKISPFQGRKDPEKMSADDTKSLIEDAEVDGPLVDWKEKGSTGRVSRHRRRGWHAGAQAESHAEERRRQFRLSRSGSFPRDPDHHPTDRARRAGRKSRPIWAITKRSTACSSPFSIEAGRKGDPDKQKIIIDKAEGERAGRRLRPSNFPTRLPSNITPCVISHSRIFCSR